MHRIALLPAILLAFALSACEIVVTGGSGGWPDGVRISNATYRTDTKAHVEGEDRFVICDDRVTELTYRFDYEGPLSRWTSYLRGVLTGDVIGRESFTPSTAGVSYDADRIEVTYAIGAGVAPLSEVVSPQGIRVVPNPRVLGYTRLYLEVSGSDRTARLSSREIPVLETCAT